MIDERITDALNNWSMSMIDDDIPDSLPLLDLFRNVRGTADFGAVDILVIQHQLGTNVPLVRAFATDGVPEGRMWPVDIPYSTNQDAHAAFVALSGEDRCPPLLTDPLVDYSAVQLMRVTTTLLDIWRHGQGRPLLVIDDGAYFLRALTMLRAISHPAVGHFADSFVVEQTTRGHRLLTASERDVSELGLRAVSIARTKTKERLEGPFIGATVAEAIAARVGPQGSAPKMQKIAVLGFGVVGEACARALSDRFPDARLAIVEEHPERRSAAAAWLGVDHVQPALGPNGGYDLVLGCTGRNSFKLADRHLLADGALLVSGSSAAVEFDRAGFVELADYYPDDEIEIVDRDATRKVGIHADIVLRLEGERTVTFANAGFPVNFDGRIECLPAKMIQPTRCLMYAAAAQVLTQASPGFVQLDAGPDDWIYEHGLRLLAD